jgi:hypothetical protein
MYRVTLVTRKVPVVTAMFRVANCSCRGRNGYCALHFLDKPLHFLENALIALVN